MELIIFSFIQINFLFFDIYYVLSHEKITPKSHGQLFGVGDNELKGIATLALSSKKRITVISAQIVSAFRLLFWGGLPQTESSEGIYNGQAYF